MDPNVYFTYLCFLESDHPVRKAWVRWQNTMYRHKSGWTVKLSHAKNDLKREMNKVCAEMSRKYEKLWIYEARQKWEWFSFENFIKFLEKHGFEV